MAQRARHTRSEMTPARESKPLDFRSAKEWRQWLVRNHTRSEGEWLFLHKKGSRPGGLRYSEALDEALCFGWIDGKLRAFDSHRYIQRFTPRRKGSIWSAVNKARVKRLTAAHRMTKAGLSAVAEAKKNGRWQAARSMRAQNTATPADLRTALAASPVARRNFEAMAPSYRRTYIYWITSAKRPETRAKRIQAVVRRTKENRKPGMDSPYR